MRDRRNRNDSNDTPDAGTSHPAEVSTAVLHPLIRLLARQAARDFFNSHTATVAPHDDDPT